MNEWRNYLLNRISRGSCSAAARRLLHELGFRLSGPTHSKSVLPVYLDRSSVERGSATTSPASTAWPASPPSAQLSPDLLRWAREHQQRYEEFLADKPRRTADIEDTLVLHNFGWLLALALAGAVGGEKVHFYLFEWIRRLGASTHHDAWRSFSISERLCNWLFLGAVLGAESVECARESISAQAIHLSKHLEVLSDGTANNHLINNGRALYLSGSLLDQSALIDMGRSILSNEGRRQFTVDGFLDEGSSHYQLIFTRAYLDVMWMASWTRDTETIDTLRSPVVAMLAASAFFANPQSFGGAIPRIGDISPDPPPAWFSAGSAFWQSAARARQSTTDGSPSQVRFDTPWFTSQDEAEHCPAAHQGWLCYPASGYYRWSSPDYCVWWHVRSGGLPRRHAHNDWGSFEMHIDGEPFVIDPGRFSYCDDQYGIYDGRNTLSQNSLRVDGLEQAPIWKRDLFAADYLCDNSNVTSRVDADAAMLAIEFDGYQRLVHPVTLARDFSLKANSLRIQDNVTGRGSHDLEAAFHLSPDTTCDPQSETRLVLHTRARRIVFEIGAGLKLTIKKGGDPASPGGYAMTAYGRRVETTSIIVSAQGQAPMTAEYLFHW